MIHNKTLTLISRHYFSSSNRKTTVHFVAREFAKKGYEVNFVTVGRSVLSTFYKKNDKGMPADLSRDQFVEIEQNIYTIVLNEWLHPISSSAGIVNKLSSPMLLNYGKHIPKKVEERIQDSDVVLIECGYGVAYFDTLKQLCSKAKLIYFATDPLTQVGLRPEFEQMELDSIQEFDLVRVASKELGERFPSDTNLVVIPQGIDKSLFDNADTSPYPKGSQNIISIGDMSFDYNAVIKMAMLKPNVKFHIFGADIPVEYPKNIKVYGEINFDQLVPYIKFADVGIMAYKMNDEMTYLTKTSLKFLQYSYCKLPIVTPYGANWERDNIFQYDANNGQSIIDALESALVAEKANSLTEGIWDWKECTEQLLTAFKK